MILPNLLRICVKENFSSTNVELKLHLRN